MRLRSTPVRIGPRCGPGRTGMPLPHRLPRTEHLGQIPPRDPRAVSVDDPINDLPGIRKGLRVVSRQGSTSGMLAMRISICRANIGKGATRFGRVLKLVGSRCETCMAMRSPGGGGGRMASGLRAVWCAGVPWHATRGTDQNLSSALGALGWDIDYFEPPVSVMRRPPKIGRTARGLVSVGVARLPVAGLPGARFSLVRRANQVRLRSRLRSMASTGPAPVALVSTSLDDVLSTACESTLRVLVGTDDYVAGGSLMDLDAAELLAAEGRAVRGAHVVTAVSPELAERWQTMYGRPVHLLPNGVDVEHFMAVPVARAGTPRARPSAALMGILSERLDMAILEAIPRAGIELHLIGPHRQSFEPTRFRELTRHPLVTWHGACDYSRLPGLLALADVGITPYIDSGFNRASSPLKTLEYLAAGMPAVSTPLPSVGRLGTHLVRLAADPDSFVAAVIEGTSFTDDAEMIESRQAFARRHSWHTRAEQLQTIILDSREELGLH